MLFPFLEKIRVWGILGTPYCGIGATVQIGQDMLCLPYAGFLVFYMNNGSTVKKFLSNFWVFFCNKFLLVRKLN